VSALLQTLNAALFALVFILPTAGVFVIFILAAFAEYLDAPPRRLDPVRPRPKTKEKSCMT